MTIATAMMPAIIANNINFSDVLVAIVPPKIFKEFYCNALSQWSILSRKMSRVNRSHLII